MALILSGCGSQNITDNAQTKEGLKVDALEAVSDNSSDVKLYTVSENDISTSFVGDGALSFAMNEDITYSCDYADVYLGKLNVQAGDYVKEGDLLTTLYLSFDQIDYQEKTLYLQRLKNTFDRKCAEYEADMVWMKTLPESKANNLAYEQLLHDYESYKRDTNKEIAEIEQWLQNCLSVEENNVVNIYAPYDAYIGSTINTYEWASVSSSDVLFNISSVDGWCYKIEDYGYLLKVGTKVKLSASGFSATGTIIFNDSLGGEESFTNSGSDAQAGYAWVRLDEEYNLYDLPYSVNVDASPVTINNIITIPENCVNVENGLYFVYRYIGDGVKEKVYFNCPYYKSGKCWAIDGVNVGDKLVIN